jgi:hypothetical protein
MGPSELLTPLARTQAASQSLRVLLDDSKAIKEIERAVTTTMMQMKTEGRVKDMAFRAWLRYFLEATETTSLDMLQFSEARNMLRRIVNMTTGERNIEWTIFIDQKAQSKSPDTTFTQWIKSDLMTKDTDTVLKRHWTVKKTHLKQQEDERFTTYWHRVRQAARDLDQPSTLAEIMEASEPGLQPKLKRAFGKHLSTNDEQAFLTDMTNEEFGVDLEATYLREKTPQAPKWRQQIKQPPTTQQQEAAPAQWCAKCKKSNHNDSTCFYKDQVKPNIGITAHSHARQVQVLTGSNRQPSRRIIEPYINDDYNGYRKPPGSKFRGPAANYKGNLQKPDGVEETDQERNARLRQHQTKRHAENSTHADGSRHDRGQAKRLKKQDDSQPKKADSSEDDG